KNKFVKNEIEKPPMKKFSSLSCLLFAVPFKVQSSTVQRSRFLPLRRSMFDVGCSMFLFLCAGCQVLTYSSPTGERFTRSSLRANTSIQSLSLETATNGVRRVELRGYQNDSTQALSTVTEAAVKAAVQSIK